MGRTDDAVRAYANVLRLSGENAERRADHAEALVYAAQGIVTADARRGFEAALARDPTLAKARYYLGLAAEQDGDRDKARAIWSSLAADTPPGASLAAVLESRIAALDRAAMASDVAALPADARQAAIRGMVERLAGRLHENAADIEGWLRLVRAYRVLDEADKARGALADARKKFAGDGAATARLDALARELGLES
jgi:cytochrome c-type biogenesis protein CcmH